MIGERLKSNVEGIAVGIKRAGRKNLIICASVLIIAAAICVNWVLFSGLEDNSNLTPPPDGSQDVDGNPDDNNDVASYFASVQISRQQSRDSALEVLQMLIESEGILEEEKAAAIASAVRIADEMQYESNIETLIKGKGFEDCIAVISDGKANITVKTEGLSSSEIAQIMEIVYEQANIEPDNVKINEKY